MRIIFSRARSLGSVLIRAGSWWGAWSHCSLLVPGGGLVIESVAARGGVVITPVHALLARVSEHQCLDLPTPDDAAAYAWAESTIGSPYDWGGVLAIPGRQRRWEDSARWYCSEHGATALEIAGRRLVRPGVHGIHPDTLHALMFAAGATTHSLIAD